MPERYEKQNELVASIDRLTEALRESLVPLEAIGKVISDLADCFLEDDPFTTGPIDMQGMVEGRWTIKEEARE